jgi:uncharacterized ferritin-like protein (DUF455 family)
MLSVYRTSIEQAKPLIESQPWRDTQYYAWFLSQTYYFVCHSCRLLAASASHFGISQDSLYKGFVKHIAEEKNHEALALNDLKALGKKISDFPELSITKSFYEAQYCKIDRKDPTALLGYILFLEGVSVEIYPGLYSAIEKAHGKESARFLGLHINEDPSHVDQALNKVKQLSQHQQQIIMENLVQTGDLYCDLLEKCRQKALSSNFVEDAKPA